MKEELKIAIQNWDTALFVIALVIDLFLFLIWFGGYLALRNVK